MKARKVIVIAGIVGILWYLSTQLTARTIEKINYSAGGFRIQKVSASGIEFRVGLTVTNESDISAPITAFIGRLLYEWPDKTVSTLGDLFLVSPMQLPGFGQVKLEFAMISGLAGGAYEVLNILTNGNPFNFGEVDYKNVDLKRFRIKGTLKIGPLPLDVDTTLA